MGLISNIKAATEITQDLIALKVETAVAAKASELYRLLSEVQQELFTSQAEQATLTRRIRDLEAEIDHLKHWKNEKERYELKELAPGTFVYRLKPGLEPSEPVHDLCPHCYQQGVKSILQGAGLSQGRKVFVCPHCKASFLSERVDLFGEEHETQGAPRSRRMI